ncbi:MULTISPECIES: PQQ-binding-like beta-propeller repeat protein [unclassified Streptomyces]|uniref:caspase, EACC1-associated type n=1 Tax=unclassified Streptomyces TaxID=2593676 RepID=UPI000DD54681|nr:MULTISPECIES: PQQ-binding-like beta-propeller repeat protein [unclassified Streptomyces]QZZ29901.1 PQQ-binding-like beta-propeller repeat protein [Streptomyces sp. ST1015]
MTAPAFPEGSRGALLIGTGKYDHPELADLLSPAEDCSRLSTVLRDPEVGAFEVQQLVDADQSILMRAMEQFFGSALRNDVRLLYLSCHGIVNDRDGKLHFAVRATDPEWPAYSSIAASFVHDLMETCRARSIIVILDCCYSGRFLPGAKGSTGPDGFTDALAGHGRVIITAGNRTQRAYEGDHTDRTTPAPSRFTGPLVEGLRTGAADLNGDGIITVRELYDYVCERLHEEGVEQNPRMGGEMQYDIALARVKPKPRRTPRKSPRPAPPRRSTDLPWTTLAASGQACQPVSHHGTVIVQERYRLHVIDTETRRRLCSVSLKYPGPPAFYAGAVYFPGVGGRLQAVDLRTGRQRPCRPLKIGGGPLAVADSVLYAHTSEGRLHAVDLRTGDDCWTPLDLPEVTASGPLRVAFGQVLLTGKASMRLMAIDASSGQVEWSHDGDEPLSPSWTVTPPGLHLFAPSDNTPAHITTLDRRTGKVLWRRELRADVVAASPPADGLLVFGDTEHRLFVLDASTGSPTWKQARKTEGRLITRPIAVGSILYTADRSARLTSWRLRDGRKLRTHDVLLSEDHQGAPAADERALYITDSQGNLHGLATT